MTKSNPHFCAIAPIEYLHLVAGRPFHLALAHLVEQSAEYADFYKKEADQGSVVYLDNSCYEYKAPIPAEKLIELGKRVNATALVIPDYIFEPSSKTIEAAERYAPAIKAAGFKTFFVPQSANGDYEDWISAYQWAAANPLIDIIGISILGVPNAWSNIEPSFARVVAMQTLLDRGIFNSSKHHHFLGLNGGPALEIPSLIRMGVLDTIDSSGPIWSAIQGHRYTTEADSYQQVRKLTSPVNFHLPRVRCAVTMERIAWNLRLTDELFDPKAYNTDRIWYAQE